MANAVGTISFGDPPLRGHLIAQRTAGHVAMIDIGAIAEDAIHGPRRGGTASQPPYS
jgi:hypothetical protein